MKFKAQIQNTEFVNWKASQINALLAHEYAKIGRYWHRVVRPRHFGRGAFQRYGYAPRRKGYIKRKKRLVGHARPLVLSGETEAASSQHRVMATRKGVTITYRGLRKLNFKPRNSEVNMRKEFETVSDTEFRQMSDIMSRSIDKKLQTAARNGGRLTIRS